MADRNENNAWCSLTVNAWVSRRLFSMRTDNPLNNALKRHRTSSVVPADCFFRANTVDCFPIVDQLLVDCRPAVGRLSADSWPTFDIRPRVGGDELFFTFTQQIFLFSLSNVTAVSFTTLLFVSFSQENPFHLPRW